MKRELPLSKFFEIELFGVLGINFIEAFSRSFGYKYILLAITYVSKRVEAMDLRTMNGEVLLCSSRSIFSQDLVPKRHYK